MTNALQFLTIVSTIILAVIGYFYSKKLEILKENRKHKALLFSQYIQVSNKYSFNKSADEENKVNSDYSEICEKLCLYASENVLIKIAKLNDEFAKNGNYLKTTEGKINYSELVIEMRKDVGLRIRNIDTDSIIKVLELDNFK